jgi:hypothetical protein
MKKPSEVALVNSEQKRPSLIAKGSLIAVRKVLSHYWDNSSVFGIDLVGAVLRQGTFVQKMHKLDWLHSPNVMSTVQRLIVKYHRFIRLAAEYRKQTVVPTLDIDLAWVCLSSLHPLQSLTQIVHSTPTNSRPRPITPIPWPRPSASSTTTTRSPKPACTRPSNGSRPSTRRNTTSPTPNAAAGTANARASPCAPPSRPSSPPRSSLSPNSTRKASRRIRVRGRT